MCGSAHKSYVLRVGGSVPCSLVVCVCRCHRCHFRRLDDIEEDHAVYPKEVSTGFDFHKVSHNAQWSCVCTHLDTFSLTNMLISSGVYEVGDVHYI